MGLVSGARGPKRRQRSPTKESRPPLIGKSGFFEFVSCRGAYRTGDLLGDGRRIPA